MGPTTISDVLEAFQHKLSSRELDVLEMLLTETYTAIKTICEALSVLPESTTAQDAMGTVLRATAARKCYLRIGKDGQIWPLNRMPSSVAAAAVWHAWPYEHRELTPARVIQAAQVTAGRGPSYELFRQRRRELEEFV